MKTLLALAIALTLVACDDSPPVPPTGKGTHHEPDPDAPTVRDLLSSTPAEHLEKKQQQRHAD